MSYDNELLLDFGGKKFYFDFVAAANAVMCNQKIDYVEEVEETITYKEDGSEDKVGRVEKKAPAKHEVDVTKFEMLRWAVTLVMGDEPEEYDAALGAERALDDTSLAFKIAFNTLVAHGIIKEIK